MKSDMGCRKMEFGEQLKKTRTLLGLTQKEMAAGIVTGSFYSRVEHGQHDMNVDDLLQILNVHQVSLYDFFEGFTTIKSTHQKIQEQLILAFSERNIDLIRKLEKSTNDYKLKLEAQLMTAILQDTIEGVPKKLKHEIKKNILMINSWNEKSLWELTIAIPIFQPSELKLLTGPIFEKYDQFDLRDGRLLSALANFELTYLIHLVNEGEQEDSLKLMQKISDLPEGSEIFFQKLLAKWYWAKFKNDTETISMINNLLSECDYDRYVKGLHLCEWAIN